MLDKVQKEIVESKEQNIVVVAGAGSGKTRVLTERIKYLVEERGVEPVSIVAITFTNMASEEMRSRLIDVKGIGDAFIGTIHSFANKVYKNSGASYEIMTSERVNEFMKHLIKRYAKDLTWESYMYYEDLRHNVDLGLMNEEAIGEMIAPSHLYEIRVLMGEIDHEEVYPHSVKSMCEAQNIITFDKLLQIAKEYFMSLGTAVEYLFVDELQDIGFLEYKFIEGLDAYNSFYVGDDWQSIYAFKGGDVNIFKSLIKKEGFKTYYLENNYRNCEDIINVSRTVIEQADNILPKNQVCCVEERGSVSASSKYSLGNYLDAIKAEGEFSTWFILVRTNADVMTMVNELTSRDIPFDTFKKSNLSFEELQKLAKANTIKLLTVHSAKGLESDNVLLFGNFPVKQKPYLRNSDERKVMYVALTRARKNLIILN